MISRVLLLLVDSVIQIHDVAKISRPAQVPLAKKATRNQMLI